MQYTQLKQVIDIDDQIINLHKELSSLYVKRAVFLGTSPSIMDGNKVLQNSNNALNDPWIIQTYSYLASAWAVHGITIPSVTEIGSKLAKARKIIANMTAADPGLGSQMGVLLVPPAGVISFPLTSSVRQNQSHVLLGDYANPDLLKAGKFHKKTWQLLVVHTGLTGVDYGSAAKILKYKKYVIANYDARALGLRQYAALSLQLNHTIDQNVWTVLLADKLTNNTLIPSATFLNGQYRFELDESNSILGEERFRPAVEIK